MTRKIDFCFLNVFFPLRQVKQAVIWALQAGYRHIDCAAIYDNEAEIGEALYETVGPGKVKAHGRVANCHMADLCVQLNVDTHNWHKHINKPDKK